MFVCIFLNFKHWVFLFGTCACPPFFHLKRAKENKLRPVELFNRAGQYQIRLTRLALGASGIVRVLCELELLVRDSSWKF